MNEKDTNQIEIVLCWKGVYGRLLQSICKRKTTNNSSRKAESTSTTFSVWRKGMMRFHLPYKLIGKLPLVYHTIFFSVATRSVYKVIRSSLDGASAHLFNIAVRFHWWFTSLGISCKKSMFPMSLPFVLLDGREKMYRQTKHNTLSLSAPSSERTHLAECWSQASVCDRMDWS